MTATLYRETVAPPYARWKPATPALVAALPQKTPALDAQSDISASGVLRLSAEPVVGRLSKLQPPLTAPLLYAVTVTSVSTERRPPVAQVCG